MGFKEIFYKKEHWKILKDKRRIAIKIMENLQENGLKSVIYGSIARGDIKRNSDVDVFIPYKVPSYRVEMALEREFKIFDRTIVQATPFYGIKAYITLDLEGKITVSFPLVKLTRRESEFYKFSGSMGLSELKRDIRVPGVNKKLILIEPTKFGHIESPVIGRENEVAEILGISPDIVLERVNVLCRREEIGRTGVFLKYSLKGEETFESALKRIARENALVRKFIKEREGLI